jgi:hypothetical protein
MLYGVTATGTKSAWAVGAQEGRAGRFRTLIEHWTGQRWVTVPSPNPGRAGDFLYSVSASAGRVYASGQQFSGAAPDRQIVLALRGHHWRTLRTAGAAGSSMSPFAIAASPTGLWLAGSARSGHRGYQSLVEHGTGGTVTRISSPNPTPQDNYLWSVAPAGGAAWAVGHDVVAGGTFESLTEFGRAGGGWRIVPSPNPGLAHGGGSTVLGGVAAFGPGDVWAVGYFDGANARRTLILNFTAG